MSNDETCDDADSTTTIFSTSSQGSALSLISRNSAELLKLKQEIDTNMQDPRTEALALVNNLLQQRQTAVRLLEDISNRPTPEPYVAPALRTPQSLVQEESTEPVAEEEEMKPEESSIQMSSKEFFRRIRQRLSKKEFKAFVRNMKELNTLREERVRRKYVSIMHPLPFSCWPKIQIDPGDWENVVATS